MCREGATLQVQKCVWTALAPATRELLPPDAKIDRAKVVRFDANGQPETIYGVDIKGIPVGVATSTSKHAMRRLSMRPAMLLLWSSGLSCVQWGEPRSRAPPAFVLERTCTHPQPRHLLRSAYPSDVRQYAARFDQILLSALARADGGMSSLLS
jgi:hypothetical protein